VGGEALDYEMTRSKKRYYSLKLALELHQPCKSSERPDYANLELTLIERINLWPLDCGGPVPLHRLHVHQNAPACHPVRCADGRIPGWIGRGVREVHVA
jgi:hypothetical protein